MEKKVLKHSNVLALSIAAMAVLIDWRVSLGIVLGLFAFNVYFQLLIFSVEEKLRTKRQGDGIDVMGIVRIAILIIAPAISWFLPEYVNCYGTIFGILSFKLTAYASAAAESMRKGRR